MSDQGTEADAPATQPDDSGVIEEQTRARLRSPLLVGCIAYAILTWMLLVVTVIYAWKLFGS